VKGGAPERCQWQKKRRRQPNEQRKPASGSAAGDYCELRAAEVRILSPRPKTLVYQGFFAFWALVLLRESISTFCIIESIEVRKALKHNGFGIER